MWGETAEIWKQNRYNLFKHNCTVLVIDSWNQVSDYSLPFTISPANLKSWLLDYHNARMFCLAPILSRIQGGYNEEKDCCINPESDTWRNWCSVWISPALNNPISDCCFAKLFSGNTITDVMVWLCVGCDYGIYLAELQVGGLYYQKQEQKPYQDWQAYCNIQHR